MITLIEVILNMNLLAKYNKKHQEQISKVSIPDFRAGDTLRVHLKIFDDNENQRIQIFEGLCIARRNSGLGSTFRVRKISYNEGVEKNLLLYSPTVDKIEVIKKGKIRRAKLYYIRALRGKAMRIEDLNLAKMKNNKKSI
jgi:large subunit ribosomal protein L19